MKRDLQNQLAKNNNISRQQLENVTPANSLNITPVFPGESLNESEREEEPNEKFGYKLRNDSRIITDLRELDGLDQSEDCESVNDEFERSESSSEEEKKVTN